MLIVHIAANVYQVLSTDHGANHPKNVWSVMVNVFLNIPVIEKSDFIYGQKKSLPCITARCRGVASSHCAFVAFTRIPSTFNSVATIFTSPTLAAA